MQYVHAVGAICYYNRVWEGLFVALLAGHLGNFLAYLVGLTAPCPAYLASFIIICLALLLRLEDLVQSGLSDRQLEPLAREALCLRCGDVP